MQRACSLAVGVAFACACLANAGAQDVGNTTAQEYGDAVYVYLEDVWSEIGYNYNHTAIFAGLDSNNNGRVLQAYGSGTTTMETNFYDFFTSYGSDYYGAYTLTNGPLTFSQRKSIVSTAINLANAQIPYPSTFLQIPVCIDYAGTPPVSVANIDNIRCDGVIEYSYTYNGLRVWHNTTTPDNQWGIVNYPDSYNDRPDLTRDPDFEASPWAQRGAPCDTGPGIYTIAGWRVSSSRYDNDATSSNLAAHLPSDAVIWLRLCRCDDSGDRRVRDSPYWCRASWQFDVDVQSCAASTPN